MAYTCDFDDLSHELMKMDAAAGAAEAQGMVCGMMCAQGRVDKLDWVKQVLGANVAPGDLLIKQVQAQLFQLHQETLEGLYDQDFAFELFLPDDDVSLAERMDMLSEWCQGFMLGFSSRSLDELDGEVGEEITGLIEDFIEITRIDLESFDDPEEDENSFFEITEYIRMGVIFIFTNLQPVTTSPRLQ